MNWLLLKNSLLVASLTTVVSLLFGFFAALWASGSGLRQRNLIFALAIIAFALPPFLVTNCWLHFFGNAGVWRSWLPFNVLSFGGAIWILSLMLWPVSFFFFFAAWRRMEPAYLESEPMLRGGSLVRWLLLPMAQSEMLQATVLTFVLALNNFAVPAILQVKVFPAELWVDFNTTFNYVSALKLGWPLALLPLLVILIFRRRQNISWMWTRRGIAAAAFKQQLGPVWFRLAMACGILAAIFSVGFPVVQLCFSPQTWSDLVPALAAGQRALSYSTIFAALTASVVVAVASVTWRYRVVLVSWFSFLIPGVLLGVALIWLFNRPGLTAFYQSIGIVVLAFAIRYFAPGWTGIACSIEVTDRSLADAAETEGAGRWQIFRSVYLPQIFPQLCAVWYAVYLFCLWDVETLVLIVPPGCETVSLRIFNLLHYGHNSQVNALCLLLLGLALLPLALWLVSRALVKTPRRSVSTSTQLACIAAVGFLAGCSDSKKENSANRFSIQSKIFSHVEIIGSRGTAPGQFNKPRSLALDKDDNLFVVDMTGRVQKLSSNGVYLLSWQMPQTDLGKPKGMSRDKDGNIIVVEPHYQRVNHFSPDGKLVAQWGTKGTNEGELTLPRSVAVNSRGEIIVSEYTTVDRVQVFSPGGKKWLFSFGRPGSGEGEFNRAEGVGVDAKDRIYVADSCNHRIQIFSPEGKFLAAYGRAGGGAGELSYPYDVRVDSAGLQYVCEFGNSRIQIFDVNNQSIEILGGPGAAPGQFANPWSIAFDSQGNLYVADSQNHRVLKFIRRVAPASRGLNLPSRLVLAETENRSSGFQIGPARGGCYP